MSDSRKWTLAIKRTPDSIPRKITKIIGLNGDGFSVLAPYHKARSGFLCKMPVDPSKTGEYYVPAEEVEAFTVDDRAKLSYHTDGFIQFSSANPGRIISGRDPSTGEPKGLGLMTHPLTTPIWMGPSASVTVWGLDDFDETKESKNLLIYEEGDFYYRGCTPEQADTWMISIYPFPVNAVPPIRFERGSPVLEMTVDCLNGALASVVRMKVINLPEEKIFLGVYINAFVGRFPSASGWILGGAGRWGKDRPGHVLKGVYPRELFSHTYLGSLDRNLRNSSDREQRD
jgi:hypothetical protein